MQLIDFSKEAATMAKDAVESTSLPGEINAASRTLHTQLNRLITTRLPLCLPPHASSPSLYTTGLLHFAHIYLTFESAWADLPSSSSSTQTSPLLSFLLIDPRDADDTNPTITTTPSPQMLDFLATLRPKGLARSSRLKRDLQLLTGLSELDLSVQLSHFPGPHVQDYCAHIRRTVAQKPHTLVAYAWCYYMAVFSGGRWIRSELLNKGGEAFWRQGSGKTDEPVPLSEAGLSFLHFPGTEDGIDIKAVFKQRLEAAETLFTPAERADVIAESQEIFKYSAALVHELDANLATDLQKVAAAEAAEREQEKDNEKGKEKAGAGDAKIPARQSPHLWFRRPEVTGAALALGCVALLAFSHLSMDVFP
ncbi:heme oxygenase-like protein [Lepidopterella palustris CBS 459.81]|uniref:Heme oxygenase-like protein n=1 Tax=Lepidopterella palustris CBS 459.81 TaxID=1314670 RepID=A0A8E2ELD8_9PEZI|nr:heme oxygenase-like protein [Lepidopterella palustris CBS 459.81]